MGIIFELLTKAFQSSLIPMSTRWFYDITSRDMESLKNALRSFFFFFKKELYVYLVIE